MFPDYNNMATESLVDLLAQETQKITQLPGDKQSNMQYEELRNNIRNIQAAIEARKVHTISDPAISFNTTGTSQ